MQRKCELYRHFDKDGRLLYVGISYCTPERLAGHRGASDWFDEIVRIEIERYPSRAEAHKAEIEAIKNEKPIHNLWTDARRGSNARRPEVEAQRQVVIAEAAEKNIKINKVWCLALLKHAIVSAEKGIRYPYQ